jgi:hypothetical protein
MIPLLYTFIHQRPRGVTQPWERIFLHSLFFHPKDEGDMFHRNFGWSSSTDYKALYPITTSDHTEYSNFRMMR